MEDYHFPFKPEPLRYVNESDLRNAFFVYLKKILNDKSNIIMLQNLFEKIKENIT